MKTEDVGKKNGPPVEDTGVNVRAVMIFCIVLVLVAAIVHIIIWVSFNYLNAREKSQDPELSPLISREQQLPPEPRLQAMPNVTQPGKPQIFQPLDLSGLKQIENDQLSSYGWVDEKAGIVRIPIDRAIDLIVERENHPPVEPGNGSNEQP